MSIKRQFLSLFLFFLAGITSIEATAKKYEVAACMMFQNESFFLKEWIEFHKLVGISHFYLFNNNSTDNYLSILKPYIDRGEVELFHVKARSYDQASHAAIQYRCYNRAIRKAANEATWLAIIDADEFLVPLKFRKLPVLLRRFKKYGGVYVNWLMFGTAGVRKVPRNKLVIEALNRCSSKVVELGKSIVRPERVEICMDAHRMHYKPPFTHVNMNEIEFDWIAPVAQDGLIIHHYYTGDIHHLVNVKFPRRSQWQGIQLKEYIRSLDPLNAVKNDTMQRFIPELKQKMGL